MLKMDPMFKQDLLNTPTYKLENQVNQNTLYIKRDDLIPFSFGGNKVRKNLLFFQDLIANHCNYVVTYGSRSSNHTRVVANLATAHHMKCLIIVPEEDEAFTENTRINLLLGAKIRVCPLSAVKQTIDDTLKELENQGFRPYFIPGGGHGDLGTKAYAEAYREIKAYQTENGITFDYIFLTSGTGTTQAGLIVGQTLHQDTVKIIGISNARRNPYGATVVLDSANSYLTLLGHEKITMEHVQVVDDYVLKGYGSFNEDVLSVVRRVLMQEGIPLDHIYTGKAFWGMEQYIQSRKITHKKILFIHTGGTPLFFDTLEEMGR